MFDPIQSNHCWISSICERVFSRQIFCAKKMAGEIQSNEKSYIQFKSNFFQQEWWVYSSEFSVAFVDFHHKNRILNLFSNVPVFYEPTPAYTVFVFGRSRMMSIFLNWIQSLTRHNLLLIFRTNKLSWSILDFLKLEPDDIDILWAQSPVKSDRLSEFSFSKHIVAGFNLRFIIKIYEFSR